MNRLKMNHSILRFMLMYAAFSFIFVLLLVPIYIYIYNISEQNELDRADIRLKNGASILDNTTLAMQNIVETTGKDSRFQVLKYESVEQVVDPIIFTQLHQVFSSLIISQSQVADAGIIFSDLMVLTRQRSFYSDEYYHFYDQFLKCDGRDYKGWIALLYENSGGFTPVKTYTSRDYGNYDAITYVLKWPSSSVKLEKEFYATLPINWLLPLLADNDIITQGYIRISDNQGRDILNHQYITDEGFRSIQCQTTSGLNIEVGIPFTMLHSQLIPIKNLMIVYSVCILFIALILIIFFAYRSSAPIRKLIHSVSKSKHVRAEYETCSRYHLGGLSCEYDEIASSFTALDRKIDTYQQMILHQKELIQTQLMEKALYRGLHGKEETLRFTNMFPKFPVSYCLAVLSYEMDLSSFNSEKTVEMQWELIKQIRMSLPGISAFSINNDMAVIILPLEENESPFRWSEILRSLRRKIMDECALPVVYATSDSFGKPQDLEKAYRQIQYINPLSQSIFMTETESCTDEINKKCQLPLSISNLQTLYEALTTGNKAIALSIIKECNDLLFLQSNNLPLCKHIYSIFCNLIIHLRMENTKLLSDIIIPCYRENDRYQILHEQIPECFNAICDRVLSAQNSQEDDIALSTIQYIDKNLINADLYVSSAADYFNISAPTLQKLVKKATGHTFSSYVEEQRLTKAFHLLSNSQLSIAEVSLKSGFINANSFYKAFKRKYGISPSSVQKRKHSKQE